MASHESLIHESATSVNFPLIFSSYWSCSALTLNSSYQYFNSQSDTHTVRSSILLTARVSNTFTGPDQILSQSVHVLKLFQQPMMRRKCLTPGIVCWRVITGPLLASLHLWKSVLISLHQICFQTLCFVTRAQNFLINKVNVHTRNSLSLC